MSDFFIGIDVGGTNIKMMIMTEKSEVVNKTTIPTEREKGFDSVSNNIIRVIREMFSKKGIDNPHVLAVGMGLPGTINKKENKTICLAALKWDDFNPAEKIGDFFHAPSYIDNDANINALGEYTYGMMIKKSVFVLITLGTGVGCGVIVDGKIFGGGFNLAAELGHMIIQADGGDLCLCGRRGHLEAYCSGTALKREALNMMTVRQDTILHEYISQSNGIYDNSMITRGVKAGDKTCKEIMDRFIHYLSAGVTNVMMLYNPDLIAIGGGISNAGDILIKPLNHNCKNMVLDECSYCPVFKATLGSEAGMYGACALAKETFYSM